MIEKTSKRIYALKSAPVNWNHNAFTHTSHTHTHEHVCFPSYRKKQTYLNYKRMQKRKAEMLYTHIYKNQCNCMCICMCRWQWTPAKNNQKMLNAKGKILLLIFRFCANNTFTQTQWHFSWYEWGKCNIWNSVLVTLKLWLKYW